MSPDVQVLLSGALTFGVPLALAVRELLVAGRRPSGGPERGDGDANDPDPTPAPDGDALLPPLPAAFAHLTRVDAAGPRVRERGRALEDA